MGPSRVTRALFDTNILIDFLNKVPEARAEIERYDEIAISPICWLEVMKGATPETETVVREFLANFTMVELDVVVMEQTVMLRRLYPRLRLPDAIIWASALAFEGLLVTRNTKDLPVGTPGVHMPYTVPAPPSLE
jgi:predicted nucleic acid-binding protein